MNKRERLFEITASCSKEHESRFMRSISMEFLQQYGKALVERDLDRLTAQLNRPMGEFAARAVYNYTIDELNTINARLSQTATEELRSRFDIPDLVVTIRILQPFNYSKVSYTPWGCLLGLSSWLRGI